MPLLQRLCAGHASAVLDFELANRAYFAESVSDRGDAFYAHFTGRLLTLLSEQQAGSGAYHVLIAEDGSVLGRFNLHFEPDGAAELGYRVAQHAGFVPTGPADPAELGGAPGTWYERVLADA